MEFKKIKLRGYLGFFITPVCSYRSNAVNFCNCQNSFFFYFFLFCFFGLGSGRGWEMIQVTWLNN